MFSDPACPAFTAGLKISIYRDHSYREGAPWMATDRGKGGPDPFRFAPCVETPGLWTEVTQRATANRMARVCEEDCPALQRCKDLLTDHLLEGGELWGVWAGRVGRLEQPQQSRKAPKVSH